MFVEQPQLHPNIIKVDFLAPSNLSYENFALQLKKKKKKTLGENGQKVKDNKTKSWIF